MTPLQTWMQLNQETTQEIKIMGRMIHLYHSHKLILLPLLLLQQLLQQRQHPVTHLSVLLHMLERVASSQQSHHFHPQQRVDRVMHIHLLHHYHHHLQQHKTKLPRHVQIIIHRRVAHVPLGHRNGIPVHHGHQSDRDHVHLGILDLAHAHVHGPPDEPHLRDTATTITDMTTIRTLEADTKIHIPETHTDLTMINGTTHMKNRNDAK